MGGSKQNKKKLAAVQPEAEQEAPTKKMKEGETASAPPPAPAPAPAPVSTPPVQQQPPTAMEVDATQTEAKYPPSILYPLPDEENPASWAEFMDNMRYSFPDGWRKMEIVRNGNLAAIWLNSWRDYNQYVAYSEKMWIEDEEEGPFPGVPLWKPPVKPRRIRKRPQKFLIRGLPWKITFEELEDHFGTLGLKTAAVYHQKHDRTRLPLVIIHAWRGDGENAAAPQSILSLTEILGVQVHVSKLPPHMEAPPQCYRCQVFGHIAKHCRAPEVCVACGGPHRKAACTLKRSDTPRCPNCGGAHVASWKGCKAFVRAQQRSRKQEKTARLPRATTQPTASRRPRGGRQGAAPTGGPQTATQSASRHRHQMEGTQAQGSAPSASPTTTRSRRGGGRARQRAAAQSALRGRRVQEGAPAARPVKAALDRAVLDAIDAAVQRAVATAVQAAVQAALEKMLPLLQPKP